MYKVFNQHRAIIFTEDLTFCELTDEDSLVELAHLEDVHPVYQKFIRGKIYSRLIFLIKNKLSLFVDKFLAHFKMVEAAGGLIINPKGELLMIQRFGKWDLPKGKIEKNEQIKTAAIRECMEETNVGNVSIIRELESTYHIYKIDYKPMLKRTYWFEMKTEFGNQLKPQLEEGIEQVKWMSRAEVVVAMKNTFESLKELIENNYLQQ